MTDPTNKDEKGKPILKLIVINEDIPEEIEEDLQTQLVHLYSYTRQVFLEIEDIEQYEEAVKHLRRSFLAALNPLKNIDNQFDEWIEEE